MKLFKMKDWKLTVDEELWGLKPFKALLDRDKTKEKEVANAELLFIWYWADVKSDYLLLNEKDRLIELKKDITALPKNWTKDKLIDEAVVLYKKLSRTILQDLYQKALQSAKDVGDYLENTKALLYERDKADRPVTKISDITRGLKDVKIIMKDLKAAEKEVIKETEDNENKTKGSKSFALFEDGLN
jgi:hypothetical protein